jgi:hypothetical protein
VIQPQSDEREHPGWLEHAAAESCWQGVAVPQQMESLARQLQPGMTEHFAWSGTFEHPAPPPAKTHPVLLDHEQLAPVQDALVVMSLQRVGTPEQIPGSGAQVQSCTFKHVSTVTLLVQALGWPAQAAKVSFQVHPASAVQADELALLPQAFEALMQVPVLESFQVHPGCAPHAEAVVLTTLHTFV